ncbi:MAG: patatin-like phospholipase family protein [Myxococcaceae bacterium]|nr:patatin-like phospholipase family protein [Myxococcaceae bacterium]MBH2006559.1 patatin-like phospholipase family protein [Myxococcaceae bacterium]
MALNTALVLSGGGARGAYEAGVLKYIRGELPPRIQARVHFDIFCGTSVGAVNCCFLATLNHMPQIQGEALAEMWKSLRIDGMYQIGLREILNLPKFLFGSRGRGELDEVVGPNRLGGLFNTSPMERLMHRAVRWHQIGANLQSGDLKSIAVAATHVAEGNTHVFLQRASTEKLVWGSDRQIVPYEVVLGPQHALASAAIPWVFPAVEIEGEIYCDGGIKLNTPIAPAVTLGAERIFLVSLRTDALSRTKKKERIDRYPSALFLLGKVLNALMVDKTDYDLERLERFNVLAGLWDSEVADKMKAFRGEPYRQIDNFVIRPSEDIGLIAGKRLRTGGLPERVGGIMGWFLDRMAKSVDDEGADVLSYFLFDAEYANDLIELGMHDADAQRQKLIEFFS